VRYVLHPGWVESKNDGESHYITAPQLAKLYNVSWKDCVLAGQLGRRYGNDNATHLSPSYSGNYPNLSK